MLQSEVIVPDKLLTCHAGSGSLIDFGVVSRCLVPYIAEFSVITDVPWGPHDGLRVRLHRSPRLIMVRSLRRPRPFEDAERTTTEGRTATINWQAATEGAREQVGSSHLGSSDVAKAQQKLVEQLGTTEVSNSLGHRLATWAYATESQALAQRGITTNQEEQAFRGRAQAPDFTLKPLMQKPRIMAGVQVPGGYGATARLWATGRALSAKLRTAHKRNANAAELCLMRARIVALARRSTSGIRCAWEAIDDKADVTAGLFAILTAGNPGTNIEMIEQAIGTFERLEAKEACKSREMASHAYHQWLSKALAGGARMAHRWTNRPNVDGAEIVINGISEPMRKAQFHRDAWAQQWQADREAKITEGLAAVNELRTRALQQQSHGVLEAQFTADTIRKAARAFSRHTSVGADCTSFRDIAEASNESLSELADIMRTTIRHLALPTQTLCVLCALIGKKLGGTRCIAVCSTFWRLLAAIAKHDVRNWDERIGLPGDSALPGRSPHEETAWRHLQMEQAVLRGKVVIHILWDVAKFFDSIDIPRLIRRCEELEFPLDQLALAMQVHRAPRVIQAGGCCANPIVATGVSILAGCTFSTSLSRGFLHDSTAQGSIHTHEQATATTNQHVDDVSQLIIGDTASAAIHLAVRAGLSISTGFVKSGLTISAKSVINASSKDLACRAARALARAGQTVTAVTSAEDLGVSSGCGARRSVSSLAKRFIRGAVRSRRVQTLVRANHLASKLYLTGVRPQQQYGACISGAAPSQVREMRRAAIRSVKNAGTQPCTTTTLAWRLGNRRDPGVQVPLDQIKLWMRLWGRANTTQRRDIRIAWSRALPRILLNGIHWERVSGPMQATIAVLSQIGWHPVQPNRWMDGGKDNLAELEWATFANTAITEAVAEELERLAWRDAASHFLGAGLETGTPNLDPARAARKWLLKNSMFKEVKALDVIVCGGVWTDSRKGEPMVCQACGEVGITMYHRYWSCPKLCKHPDESVRSTQWLRKLFDQQHSKHECWWGRAILPAELMPAQPRKSIDDHTATSTPGFTELLMAQQVAYTDGSGGPKWTPKGIRNTGSAIATMRLTNEPSRIKVRGVGIATSSTPGRQTVPRAEVWAAIMAAHAATDGQCISLHADASYVVKGLQQVHKQEALRCGSNGDLWDTLLELIEAKHLTVTTYKVKSHAEVQVLLGDIDTEHYLGNLLADAGADAAAERAVDTLGARDASQAESITFSVARRLAAIEAALWDDKQHLVPEPPTRARITTPTLTEASSNLGQSILAQGHKLHRQGLFTV